MYQNANSIYTSSQRTKEETIKYHTDIQRETLRSRMYEEDNPSMSHLSNWIGGLRDSDLTKKTN